MNNPISRHALAFAGRGLPVLPLHPAGKAPLGALVPCGARDASVDPERIRRWWRAGPSSNLGVTLPGLLVIDVDPRSGGEVSSLPALPNTWRARTGGGGSHIWLQLPQGAAITGGNDKLGGGIDVKTGAGSYVVAPPSLTTGCYRWISGHSPDDLSLAVAPAWLIGRLAPPPAPPQKQFRLRTNDDQRVVNALTRIPADDRDIWWKVGAALKAHFGESGRELWDDWSATSAKFDPITQVRTWRSFQRNGIGLGTIFHLAKEHPHAE